MGEWAVLTSPAERWPPPADLIEPLAHTFEQGAPLTFPNHKRGINVDVQSLSPLYQILIVNETVS